MLITLGLSAQSKYVANQYFGEFAYKESAEAYTNIYNRGDDSYEVISRVADSYYFNTEVEQAQEWYAKLYEKYPESMETEHLFRYAQSLKGVGNYKKADELMKSIGQIDSFDTRSEELNKKPNYLKDYTDSRVEVISLNNLEVNTEYSDFGGFMYKGKLYFASAKPTKIGKKLYKWNEQPFLNLYEGNLSYNQQKGLQLKEGNLMNKTLNTKFHEANAVITKDGKTMYFTRDNHHDGKTKMSKDYQILLKLYKASNVGGKWTDIVELPFNSDEYSVGHPALSPDEKTLYFVSNMPGTYGATDIYKVDILGNNHYSEPQNLGNQINTEGREMFPYVGIDNTLYFSSDGHLGLGNLDIFEVPILQEGFGTVKNLEKPFNSPLDDFAFFIDKNNVKGVFSSNREGGKGDDDIYSFMLKNPKAFNKSSLVCVLDEQGKCSLPNCTDPTHHNKFVDGSCNQILTGLVTDSATNRIIPNASLNLINYEGKVVATTTSDKEGIYLFNVACSESYRIVASKPNYRKYLNVLSTPNINRHSNLHNVPLLSLIEGKGTGKYRRLAIRPIYFDFDKSNIRPDSQYELENVVAVMRDNPNMRIRIESHTDARGTKMYNRRLSNARARSTRNYLISRGIAPERLPDARGYGEDQLLNNCDDRNINKCTEAQHQMNRRSYFYILE